MIKLLAGAEKPTKGTIKLGHNVEADYFAQDQYKELDPDAVLFDEIGRMAPRMSDAEVRTLLGCFLFSGDDVFKRVGVLSGGERNRFALARMLLEPHNFLLLDEPTNHLDMRAKDVLLRAMMDFTGTVVFVSHDRYFIDRLATKVFAIGDGAIEVYPGNYEEYLWALERRAEQASEKAPGGPSEELIAALESAKQERKAAGNGDAQPQPAAKKRLNPIKADKIKKRIAALEEEVGRLESESEELERELVGVAQNYARQAEVVAEMERRRGRIEACEREWEELAEKLES